MLGMKTLDSSYRTLSESVRRGVSKLQVNVLFKCKNKFKCYISTGEPGQLRRCSESSTGWTTEESGFDSL
jgi:hypothetical protein